MAEPFYVEGEYLEVDPPRLLVHNWIGSYSGPLKTVVRWEIEPHSVHGLHPGGLKKSGSGTLVRVSQQGFAGNLAVCDRPRRRLETRPRLAGVLPRMPRARAPAPLDRS